LENKWKLRFKIDAEFWFAGKRVKHYFNQHLF